MAILPAHLVNLTTAGIAHPQAGYAILDSANLLATDTDAQMLTKLMNAFYNYGRTHWTWSTNSPLTAGAPGLLTGAATNCACATFNGNLKWLAETICGINGITNQSTTTRFLTIPGAACIDQHWLGNVRSAREGFDQFRCFNFSQHYWLALGGQQYDVCYNNICASAAQMVFTTLQAPDAGALQDSHAAPGDLFKLARPLPSADYIIKLGQIIHGWPTWQLVSRAQLRGLR